MKVAHIASRAADVFSKVAKWGRGGFDRDRALSGTKWASLVMSKDMLLG